MTYCAPEWSVLGTNNGGVSLYIHISMKKLIKTYGQIDRTNNSGSVFKKKTLLVIFQSKSLSSGIVLHLNRNKLADLFD